MKPVLTVDSAIGRENRLVCGLVQVQTPNSTISWFVWLLKFHLKLEKQMVHCKPAAKQP